MPSELRARRVADRIKRELAVLVQRKVSDPRLLGLTITDVEVDRELAYATIYLTSQEDQERVLSALEGAQGYLRKELAARIHMRAFPQLRFRWDFSPDRGARIDELLDRLREEDTGSDQDQASDLAEEDNFD